MGNDLRRAMRQRRLPPDAACVLCGQDNPEVLRRERRTVLNLHEPGGKANDPDLWVVVCLNCHELNTIRQLGYGIELGRDPERTMPEKLLSVLRGLVLFLELLAQSVLSWADRLAAFIAELDANCPGWRNWGSAQA